MNNALSDKMFYKIGEVAKMAEVKTSVLRFWETEFSFLKPDKSNTGQRLYTQKEVALILEVKRLLYSEKFTIEGVKKKVNSRGKLMVDESPPAADVHDYFALLKDIKSELIALRTQLNDNGA